MCLFCFLLPTKSSWQNVEPSIWFWFQPTNVPPGSSGLTPSGSREDSRLLNEGFLQAKPEKPAAQKPRGHFLTPAPVSASSSDPCSVRFTPQGLCTGFASF